MLNVGCRNFSAGTEMSQNQHPPGAEALEHHAGGAFRGGPLGDTIKRQVLTLERSFSAPTRFKQTLSSQYDYTVGSRSRQSIRKRALRHSHRDNTQHQQQRLRVYATANKLERHQSKSISPLCLNSSSSASDSAFSRSRSTLGSESGHSSTSCAYTKDASTEKAEDGLSSSESNHSGHLEYGNPDEHFVIVWQRLTYCVPEKRLARLSACLARIKQRWLPRAVRQAPPDDIAAPKIAHDGQSSGRLQGRLEAGQAEVQGSLLEVPLEASVDGGPPRRVQRQRQVIFENLNGCVKSGQLSAILGPSGAGKTTFLKCLTSVIVSGATGSITIERNSNSARARNLKLCIIPQKDYLFDNLTVMENLLFASRIKNTQQNFNHGDNVYRIAGLLGLQACLKLKTSRLSGGQAKRVSIAQELLSQPDILILDEPTSGLDSLTCYRTVSVLRELADMSKSGLLPPLAIVMTIHQPQIKIFNLFHHVYIMSSRGSCVYTGRPEFLVDTVAHCCKLFPPPDDQNPASFIINLASGVYGSEPIDKLIELQRENFFASIRNSSNPTKAAARPSEEEDNNNNNNNNNNNSFKSLQILDSEQLKNDLERSHHGRSVNISTTTRAHREEAVDKKHDHSGRLQICEQLRKRNSHQNSFWLHTGLLVKRLWISMWRDSLLTTTRVAFHFIIPFVFYFVYSQKSGMANACPHVERELDIQDMVSDSNIERLIVQHDELILTFENVSLFFLLLYSFSMCVLAVTALSFPLNMQILLKETTNGWYTMPRFVMAKTLADLPIELTMPVVSVSIAYALTGQPSSYLCWRMLAVTAIMTLCSLISQTQGLLFGAYFMNNVQAAVFVSQASTLPWILLSGFTTRVSQLPQVLQWLSFGSIYRLGIESIVAVRYGFGMCPCDEQLVNDTPPKIVGIPEQVKSLMSYYMDTYNSSPQTSTSLPDGGGLEAVSSVSNSSANQVDLFAKIASTLSRANTYGADIVSCNDVKPFIMSAREVRESTLPTFLSILLGVLIVLKILLFYVVKIRAG